MHLYTSVGIMDDCEFFFQTFYLPLALRMPIDRIPKVVPRSIPIPTHQPECHSMSL